MFRKKVREHVLKKKPSLGALLHETIKRQWDEVGNAMKKFTYFDDWNEAAFHQCCVHSNILHYAVNEIIYVKDDANVEVTHFILEGTVLIIQKLILEKYFLKKYNKWNYRLNKDQSATVSANDPKLKLVFMQICRLDAGACFGLGEKLSKNIIIAETELKCLVVPKSIVLRNKTAYNVWERIIITMDMNTPNLKQVYQEYKNGRRRSIWQRKLYESRQYGIYYDR
ncbi:hypothetical protein O3M35_006440 [Rhynocoris fuscipes]|uniref:Cyclic nucleotide-binding domain-containing protein n=1 Tax=Rhynocoris fuscipes TaxID=488301 RepID=A0AAW1DE23_9HEMI